MATIQIKPGDTLSGLAQAHGTTVQNLMHANPNITNPDLIMAGANLNLPSQPSVQTEPRGVIPVSSLSQPTAVPETPRIERGESPTIERTLTDMPPVERVEARPVDTRESLQREVRETMDRDVSGELSQLREDVGLRQKEETARRLNERMIERDRNYQRQVEEIERNEGGLTASAVNARINRLEVQRSREMADLSFSYQVALGDFRAAEAIVSERQQDIQREMDNRMKAFQVLFNFVQNDMTESEKMQAQQEFQLKQNALQFERQKELARYSAQLQQSSPMFAAQLESQQLDNLRKRNELLMEREGEISPQAMMVLQNPSLLSQYTATERGKLLNEIANAGGMAQTVAQESTQKMVSEALGTLDSIRDRNTFIGGVWRGALNLLPGVDIQMRDSAVKRATGFTGVASPLDWFGGLPGTAGRDVTEYVETLKAQLTLPNLELLAGLGRMSQEQFRTLANASQTLETRTSSDMFIKELDRIERTLLEVQEQMSGRGAASLDFSDDDYLRYLEIINQ